MVFALCVGQRAGSKVQQQALVVGTYAAGGLLLATAPFIRWMALPIIVAFICLGVAMMFSRIREVKAWRSGKSVELVLKPPCAGSWVVIAGGPLLFWNHHAAVAAQRFAYDIMRVDGESFGSLVAAPVAGTVVSIRDEMEDNVRQFNGKDSRGVPKVYGNYVAIKAKLATVVICHLRKGSLTVKVGQTIEVGAALAECGNSGNTTISHVHVHAQDTAVEVAGDGIPIAFATSNGIRVPLPEERIS